MSLPSIISGMRRQIAELERRLDGMIQRGPVAEVDAQAGTVRIDLGGENGEAFLSPAIPYSQLAGALKAHTPPSVGQQMTVISGSGDYRQGLAVPMTWSDAEASPSASGDENVLTFGDVAIRLEGDRLSITIGQSSIVVDTDRITLQSSEVVTVGLTKLNNGTRGVVFVGSTDSAGDKNVGGTDAVLV